MFIAVVSFIIYFCLLYRAYNVWSCFVLAFYLVFTGSNQLYLSSTCPLNNPKNAS